jgi:hypothetical protein
MIPTPLRTHLLLLASIFFLAPGCAPSRIDSPDQTGAAKEPRAQPGPAPAAASTTPPPSSGDAAKSDTHTPAPSPGAGAPSEPDQQTLLLKAEETAKGFAAALARGDLPAAEAYLFTREDFQTVIHAGHRAILEGTVRTQNSTLVNKLVETLKGKVVLATFRPGSLTRSGTKGTFQKDFPVLGTSAIAMDAGGVPLEVHLDQMVFTEKGWRIFRLSLP